MRSLFKAELKNQTRKFRNIFFIADEVEVKRLDKIDESVTTKNRNCPISNTA
jgi:hypothetical protein